MEKGAGYLSQFATRNHTSLLPTAARPVCLVEVFFEVGVFGAELDDGVEVAEFGGGGEGVGDGVEASFQVGDAGLGFLLALAPGGRARALRRDPGAGRLCFVLLCRTFGPTVAWYAPSGTGASFFSTGALGDIVGVVAVPGGEETILHDPDLGGEVVYKGAVVGDEEDGAIIELSSTSVKAS